MRNNALIYDKLEQFVRKFYLNELIRGILLFVGIGLLYWLFTIFIEYFLWLKPFFRSILFYVFLVVESLLILRFIVFPLFKLSKLSSRISYHEASMIIGAHFPEIQDNLLNFLQLDEQVTNESSELMMAAIDQRVTSLNPIPFNNAINFKENKKFLPLALIPIAVIVIFIFLGKSSVFTDSMHRVVHHRVAFSPPAPYRFVLDQSILKAKQGSDFNLQLLIDGDVVPEQVRIHVGNEEYFMKSDGVGKFSYYFTNIQSSFNFSFSTDIINSIDYVFNVEDVPSIEDFTMHLHFPDYTRLQPQIIKGNGNAVVPEGTLVKWILKTNSTSNVAMKMGDTSTPFSINNGLFELQNRFNVSTDYVIKATNDQYGHSQLLDYKIEIISDQYPRLEVSNVSTEFELNDTVYTGQFSDDYGIKSFRIVYYPIGDSSKAISHNLPFSNALNDVFSYVFPSGLNIIPGIDYEYYFEVVDNDAIRGGKSARSELFSSRMSTAEELESQLLQSHKEAIQNAQQTLQKQDQNLNDFKQLESLQKQQKELSFKDHQRVQDLLNNQKLQQENLKEISSKLEENIKQLSQDKLTPQSEELQRRLEVSKTESDKQQHLLEELEKLSERMQNEELFKKLNEFKNSSIAQQKSLEQLLELAKREFIERKFEQIIDRLDSLSKEQDQLSKEHNQNTNKQIELNDKFDSIQEDLNELDRMNDDLKKSMNLDFQSDLQESIDSDMEKAKESLSKENKSNAQKSQKSAADKMKQMHQIMQGSLSGMSMEALEEDAQLLRQILNNLLAFSFAQEDLMIVFKSIQRTSSSYNTHLKKQHDLRVQFRHIDDSLFSLASRNDKITEKIISEIANTHYAIDRSLDELSEGQTYRGISHQQYAISSSNRLADMLSDVMNSMQMQMQSMGSGEGQGSPKGQGKGSGKQLSDIIQKQKGLGDKMQEGMQGKEGNSPSDSPNGNKKGTQTGNKDGSGEQNGGDESDAKLLMEIYKEQRLLRQQLEDLLQKNNLDIEGKRVLDLMKDTEKQLLNKGFKNEVFQRILNVQQQLLKLNDAFQVQDTDHNRQSNTADGIHMKDRFSPSEKTKIFLKSIELLNKQPLPLQIKYQNRVSKYFNTF